METKEVMIEKVKKVMEAPSCCAELKTAAQNWLNAIGTDHEKAMAQALVDELNADILPVDAVIDFMKTDAAAAHLGADRVAGIAKHMEEIKATGAKYCDCPACSAGLDVLNNKESIL